MADKKLMEVRRQFVEGANKAVVGQLLDDLLSEKVLNEEEVDEVKVNPKKQDQARLLIDHVRIKGPTASGIFIGFLQERDAFLTKNLGLQTFLSGAPLCQPVGGSHEEVSVSEKTQFAEYRNGIRLCPLSLFQKIQANEEIYPIKDPETRFRLALVICNIKFDHLDYRQGAEVDRAQMKLLLEGLGYNVEVKTNLCSQEMATCLKAFAAQKEHRASDGMFVVIMSHGFQDYLCGVHSDGKESDLFSISTIFSAFNNKNCPALNGTPKVVIIQACRGENDGCLYLSVSDTSAAAAAGTSQGSASDSAIQFQTDAIKKAHVESDFMCLHSTTPDHLSWRCPKTGSVFITQLIDKIKRHAWNCDLEEIFRKVMLYFESNKCQMPSKDRTTLTKKFYLFPGH